MIKKISILIICTFFFFAANLSHADIFVISKQSANVYSEADVDSSILEKAKKGDWFIYLGRSDNNKWRKVELPEGTEGWLYYTSGKIEEDNYLDSLYTSPPTPETPVGFDITKLEIHVINVGQGDSILIVANGNDNQRVAMLVDAGKPGRGNLYVVPYLKSLGISELNYIILTHPDEDHMGGLDEVLSYNPNDPGDCEIELTGKAFMPKGKSPTSHRERGEFDEYLSAVKKETGESVLVLSPPTNLFLANGVTVQVVTGGGEYIDKAANGVIDLEIEETNARSIGLLIIYNKFKFFTAGDLGGQDKHKFIENKVAPYLGNIDVLKVSHHGSDTSTHKPFLSIVKPEVAVISTGSDNNYGHPRQTVIDRLKQTNPNIAIYQTEEGDQNSKYKNKTSTDGFVSGNIVISTDGGCIYSVIGNGSEFTGKKDFTDDDCL